MNKEQNQVESSDSTERLIEQNISNASKSMKDALNQFSKHIEHEYEKIEFKKEQLLFEK
jgi:hypothetical protein